MTETLPSIRNVHETLLSDRRLDRHARGDQPPKSTWRAV